VDELCIITSMEKLLPADLAPGAEDEELHMNPLGVLRFHITNMWLEQASADFDNNKAATRRGVILFKAFESIAARPGTIRADAQREMIGRLLNGLGDDWETVVHTMNFEEDKPFLTPPLMSFHTSDIPFIDRVFDGLQVERGTTYNQLVYHSGHWCYFRPTIFGASNSYLGAPALSFVVPQTEVWVRNMGDTIDIGYSLSEKAKRAVLRYPLEPEG